MDIFTHPITALTAYRNDVDRVLAAGGTVTPTFTKISDRWTAFIAAHPLDGTTAAVAALPAAVLAGRDVETAWHAALVETAVSSIERAALINATAGACLKALRDEYAAKSGRANHDHARQAFNTTAAALIAVLADHTTAPELMVSAPQDSRDAYVAIPDLAARLDHDLSLVRLAATLAGHPEGASNTLPLGIDPGAGNRRQVWAAWESTGRAGRWGHLHDLGVTITARPLVAVTEYPAPRPIETRAFHSLVGGGIRGIAQADWDPETGKFVDPALADMQAVRIGGAA